MVQENRLSHMIGRPAQIGNSIRSHPSHVRVTAHHEEDRTHMLSLHENAGLAVRFACLVTQKSRRRRCLVATQAVARYTQSVVSPD